MNKNRGFSIFEVLVVIAVMGILTGMIIPNLNRGDIELRQATRSFSISVQRTRSEAIRSNRFVGIDFATDSFSIFIDQNNNRSYDGDDTLVSKVNLATEYPSISITKNSTNQIIFDPRGFVSGSINQTIAFNSSKSSNTINAIIGLHGQVKLAKASS